MITIIGIPISLLFTRFMLRRTHKLFKARSQTLGDLNGYIEEMVTGNKTIKAYGQEEKVIDDFDESYTYTQDGVNYSASTNRFSYHYLYICW